MKNVDIVIAIFEPNHFLVEQVHSILKQTKSSRINSIILSDDSKGKHFELIDKCLNMDERIKYIRNNTGKNGPKWNFCNALTHTTGNYLVTCDQDDIWKNNKLKVLLEAIVKNEQCFGDNTPILVASDLSVVNEDLEVINKSFFKLRRYTKDNFLPFSVCFQNTLPGCSMLFNRTLLEMSMPMKDEVTMHDWWFHLVASFTGVVEVIDEPLVLYRQHGNNVLGASKTKLSITKRLLEKLKYIYATNKQMVLLMKLEDSVRPGNKMNAFKQIKRLVRTRFLFSILYFNKYFRVFN
ncbi:glycosyltransferase [Vibrio breoganii]|uniref:glycosyltransferase n=1 Tax=Vibrio breoganii TaxID=553239 RepID=UPI00030F5512|nr:glycosyltransferase [Vibrio breoganii]OED89075.1 hypothetical protein A1QE_07055 [Vibrio breoganii ZF-55]